MRDVRRDYGKGSPIEVNDLDNPLDLLSRWMQDAIDGGVTEPNAMNIATVDSKGNPRNRLVLLKDLEGDDRGFFTNLKSDKSVEIQGHSMVSATIWWPELERQVRIEGVATQMDRGLAEDYHSSRPRKSRLAGGHPTRAGLLAQGGARAVRSVRLQVRRRGHPAPALLGVSQYERTGSSTGKEGQAGCMRG